MEQNILIEGYIEGLFLTEELIFLDESFKEFFEKLTPPKLKQFLSNTFKFSASKDLKGFMGMAKKFGLDPKKFKSKEVKSFAQSLPEEIQTGAKLAARVVKNSIPQASKSSVAAAAYFVAVMAKVKYPRSTNYMGSLKIELKSFIDKVQQFYEEDEANEESNHKIMTEDMADMAIAIGTVVALTAITGIIIIALAGFIKYAVMFALIAVAVILLDFVWIITHPV
jgi:hypothetical protein